MHFFLHCTDNNGKNQAKKPYKTPFFLGEISALRTEMPIREYPFRKIVCKSLLWYHFFTALFFSKKNFGMGLLEYIMSSNNGKFILFFSY